MDEDDTSGTRRGSPAEEPQPPTVEFESPAEERDFPAREAAAAESAPGAGRRGRAAWRAVRSVGKVAVSLVSLVALAATGYAFVTYQQVQTDMPTSDMLALPPEVEVKAPPPDDGAEDILLVGTDARTDTQGNPLPASVLRQLRTEQSAGLNTDTLIVLRIPKNGGKTTATSIPRDTWLDVPQGGQGKINSVYGLAKAAEARRLRGTEDAAAVERDSDQAGRRALVQTVQDFTQIRIDHYAEVNLFGFYLITEALGGVEVCLNHATEDKDSGASFRAGLQTISGADALSFVRQRKNLPGGDLGRIARQQAFLAAALRKVLSAGTLANPATMGDLTEALSRSLVLDPGFDLLQLAQKAQGITTGDVTFGTIPVITTNGRSPDGEQSIVEVDPGAVRQYFASLVGRGPEPDADDGGENIRVAPAAYFTPLGQKSINGIECVD